ncbi:hypothetical protein A2783_01415 [Microgenomates group bacterium RIFCSPHIGHO2_01_FULL_45_11]|nr:MAG: hypothetical protein A2783_01415 [Microgenomates group bacterium RIFCSPHIGHO2_01_FULL_45_11]
MQSAMRRLILIVMAGLVLSGCSLIPGRNKRTALNVTSEPESLVYINDREVGTTPYYSEEVEPGEYRLQLAVKDKPEIRWQTQVSLKPQLLTSVQREFGENEENSSYYVLTLESLSSKSAIELTVVTVPDSVIVKVDGEPVGFAPVTTDDFEAGEHEAVLETPGYRALTVPFNLLAGHRLTVTAQLARDQGLTGEMTATGSAKLDDEATKSASPKPTPRSKASPTPTSTRSATLKTPYVEILETGTGWLRVRSEPDAYNADNELTKVDVGKTFPYVEANDDGWYKIEYDKGKTGWIVARYAKLYE